MSTMFALEVVAAILGMWICVTAWAACRLAQLEDQRRARAHKAVAQATIATRRKR